MRVERIKIFGSAFFLGAVLAAHAEPVLRNDRYALSVSEDGAVTVETAGMPAHTLRPDFVVLSSPKDPKLVRHAGHPNYMVAPREALRWENTTEPVADINAWLAGSGLKAATGLTGEVRDVNGAREWEFRDASGKVASRITARRAQETTRPFVVGNPVTASASAAVVESDRVRWEFPPQRGFTFSAELLLPPGDEDPRITYTLTPATKAFYAVAFTGAPACALKETIAIPQECDARGHKQFNFVLSEPDLGLPRAQVAMAPGNIALTVDPSECRFRLPTIADSRFGFMLEEKAGNLRPVLFAPLFGGAGSRMDAGNSFRFTFRYIQRPGDWKETYAHIARDVHGFRDQRDNSGPGSLTESFARVMDFLADRNGRNHAMWDTQQKYYDYFTDKTGVFKPFSPLYGLSAAIVADDEAFFRDRALPAAEYALSRRYSVFAPYDNSDNKQVNSAVRTVGAPYLGYAQILSLYEILQRRTPALKALAEQQGADPKSVADNLARWSLTGDAAALAGARAAARKLSGRTEEDLFNLLDLADAGKDPADVRAAVEAAYSNAALRLNLHPVPPEKQITVDVGGVAPVHLHSFSRHSNIWGYPQPQPVPAPEQTVPAWRVARLGLPSPAYPTEYWINTHGATMRAAALGQDPFLRDIARWGVVGRFGNYPGDNRSKESLVQERPDAVEARPWDWNFATVNPGHAWDFAASLLDFLVSDAFERSRGAVEFPALRAAGTQFRVRIYGGAPGVFYGDKGVYLWLPHGLIQTASRQADWLAAHGNGNLYLALWNQSFREETVSVAIDPARAECADGEARVWKDNVPGPPVPVAKNRFTVTLSPKGITALAIPARVATGLQAKLYDPSVGALGPHSFASAEAPFGPVHAMLIRAGRGITNAFVYTEALPENVIAARLRWLGPGGEWHELLDDIYPYEFSPPVADDGGFAGVLEIEGADGKVVPSPVIALSAGDTAPVAPAPPAPKPFPELAPVPSAEAPAPVPPPGEDFIAYLRKAANPDHYGLRGGRYFPYSTPQGRRIAWSQRVWDKALFAEGCTEAEADIRLTADLARTQAALTEALAARQPAVDFAALDIRQRETLLDLALTEGRLPPELLDAVLASDWDRIVRNHWYVRYRGHAPDHVRNKAFAARWSIQ